MKRIIAFLGSFALLLALVAPEVKAQESQLELVFAENCSSDAGCEYFEESGGRLVKEEPLEEGDQFLIDLVVKNPESVGINSVKVDIKYNNTNLNALSIDPNEELLALSSPGDENQIDEGNGIINIGRAASGQKIFAQEVYVASIKFEVKTSDDTTTQLEYNNFQPGNELSDVVVLAVNEDQGFETVNILVNEPLNLKLNLNPNQDTNDNNSNNDNNQNSDNNDNNNQDFDLGSNDDDVTAITPFTEIERPTGLKVNTDNDGNVQLVWNQLNDERVKGYFVYYSTSSGVYLFRRDAANTNNHQFSNLEQDRRYFFSVTAYDDLGNESDFANEASVIVGQPGSESNPIVIDDGQNSNNDNDPDNQPIGGDEDNLTNGDDITDPDKGTTGTGPGSVVTIIAIFTMILFAYFARRLSFFRIFHY
jgi:hypothetical protein